MNQEQNQHLADDEIDLKELFLVLWQGKSWIIGTTLIAAIAAVAIALSLPNIYRSEALLAPVNSDNKGLGGLASSLGGLASLAGVSLPRGSGVDKTMTGIKVLKSRQFFANFIKKYDVLVPLLAAEDWDSTNNRLIINSGIYNTDNDTWVRDAKKPYKKIPTVQEAHKKFIEIISIDQDKETGFVTIAVDFFSPYIAKQWVDWLVQEINETIRQQDVQQAERSIAYLKEQIQATQLAELHAGLFQLIQSQTETIMLANASPEYLFKILDPAVVPELKYKPKRSVMVALSALFGVILGVLIVLIRHFLVNKSDVSMNIR
jgi:LPS O-antigen subunit length determinant protein (WzzB/FepE family)